MFSSGDEVSVKENRQVYWCVGNMSIVGNGFRGNWLQALLGNIWGTSLHHAMGSVLVVDVVIGLC